MDFDSMWGLHRLTSTVRPLTLAGGGVGVEGGGPDHEEDIHGHARA